MYERNERCASIDIAVNAANAYNVSLDYLFGIGYKKPEYNSENLYSLGFSEETLNFLTTQNNRQYVDKILSNPYMSKIEHILKNFHYKPLENYYETKYVSRLISDLLYTIMADALNDSYQLRPIAEHEVDELLTEIDSCIQHVEQLISPISLELDKFPNYDDILIELEQIRNLLENTPFTDYNTGKADGFRDAIIQIATGQMKDITLGE